MAAHSPMVVVLSLWVTTHIRYPVYHMLTLQFITVINLQYCSYEVAMKQVCGYGVITTRGAVLKSGSIRKVEN